MKTLFAAFALIMALTITACQKTYTAFSQNNGTDTTARTNGMDTIIPPPVSGPLLTRVISYWKDNSFSPEGPAQITDFTYDKAGFLIREAIHGQPATLYKRDAKERLIAMDHEGWSAYTHVHYISENSSQIAYALLSKDSVTKPDSMTFAYLNGRVAVIKNYVPDGGTMRLEWYQTTEFDARGNITQWQWYINNQYNSGCDYEYDDKINPNYQKDDLRVYYGGAYVVSPNNVVKQNNHYPKPQDNSDYLTYTYIYNAKGKPESSLLAGTTMGTQTERLVYYYQ